MTVVNDHRTTDVTSPEVRDQLLAEAHRVGSSWAHAEHALWRSGRLPEELAREAAEAGLYTMTLPADAGGQECDLLTMIDVVAALTDHLPALGWNVMIAQGCGLVGWGNPGIAKHMANNSQTPVVACALAPTGTGREEHNAAGAVTYRISGKWFINSGCQNANWFIAAFGIVAEDGSERHWGEDGVRFAVLPMSQTRVEEAWDVLGLRATGSHDVILEDIVVPHDLTFNPFHEESPRPATLYHVSFFNYLMAMMAGPVVGLGRRALRTARADLGDTDGHLRPADALEFYREDSAQRAAEAGVHEAVSAMWSEVSRQGGASLDTRARVVGAVQHAQRMAQEVTVDLMRLTGTPHSSSTALASTCRDIHAVGQHLAYSLVTEHRMAAHLHEGRTPMAFMI